jgi:cation-transporting ATPase E
VLGAPEILLENLTEGDWTVEHPAQAIESCIADHTSHGMRVLLFAHLPEPADFSREEEMPELPADLLPLGLLCFRDELRPSVQDTLDKFAGMGTEIKVISGDNPRTVTSLARQVGLIAPEEEVRVISGPQLEGLEEAAFSKAVSENRIFGRITPDLKRRLVKSLREQGHYAAMTGDGVNDVMALKQADLGIAMQSGSQATRNVAGMVLLNDSFDVLPQAFAEGQRILNGMEDILRLYLTRILYFALLIAAMGWLGNGSPFSPKQNSLISILTLSLPAFALAFWARPGVIPKASLVKRLSHFVVPAAITTSAAGLLIYIYAILRTADSAYAQTVLTYTMILSGLLLVVFVEPPTHFWVSGDAYSGDWRPTLMVMGIFLLFLGLFAVPAVRELYDLVPLRNPLDYFAIGLVILGWTFALRSVWRLHLLDRYLNIDLGGPK